MVLDHMSVFTTSAFAKVNLFLSVGAKRADGYHTVDTVMQAMSLQDTVTLTVAPALAGEDRVEFVTNCSFGAAEQNLGMIALRAYCRAAKISGYRAILQIEKRIPAGAGFGGGSADAAAVLRLCQQAFAALEKNELIALAAKIGADVPFGLQGGCCRATGFGQELCGLPSLPPCYAVLAFGGEGMRTALAYEAVDSLPTGEQPSSATLLSALQSGNLSQICAAMYNRFSAAVLPQRPVSVALLDVLHQTGAQGALLSGSGAGVFGLFLPQAKQAAIEAAAHICSMGHIAYVCEPQDCLEA